MDVTTLIRDAEVAEREAGEVAEMVAEHGELVATEYAAWLDEGGIDDLAAAMAKGVL